VTARDHVRPGREPAERSERFRADAEARSPRRTAIVEAAVALFAERGYKETTATQIAERAGVSRRLFFYYFSSKDEILFAVSEAALTRLRELVRLQSIELSDLDAVAAAWKRFRGSEIDGGEAEDVRRVVIQLRQAAAASPLLRGKEYNLHLAYQDSIAKGLADRRGLREPDTAAITAAAIGQTLMHLVADRMLLDDQLSRDQLIDEQFVAANRVIASRGRPQKPQRPTKPPSLNANLAGGNNPPPRPGSPSRTESS
jgi:AcrR family transcriptional regulator